MLNKNYKEIFVQVILKGLFVLKLLLEYLKDNLKKCILLLIIVVIGLMIGVFLFNNTLSKESYNQDINLFIENIKQKENIHYNKIFFYKIKNDGIILLIIIFTSMSIFNKIGTKLVLLYKGIDIGFVFSCILNTLGIFKGLGFALPIVFLYNVAFIPLLIILSFICTDFYNKILEKDYENKRNLIGEFFLKIIGIWLIELVNCLFYSFLYFNILIFIKDLF